jgi:hypothetical protein
MKFWNVISYFIAIGSTLSAFAVDRLPSNSSVQRPPQFILLSFDGSKSIPFWQETRAFAEKYNVGFTYFISGVYFLSGKDTQLYQAPTHGRGKSSIGFGENHRTIQTRADEVMGARNQDLEIGSHVNGHYDGTAWSFSDWTSELTQFKDLIKDVFSINRFSPNYENDWNEKVVGEIRGIRAPLLGVNSDYFKALKAAGYNYDTSQISGPSRWPYIDENGLWMFPLQAVHLAGTGKKTITMDYNVMVSQCSNQMVDNDGTQCKDATPEKFKMYEDELYETYVNLFKENYFGNRAPVVIGHHFALWNQGAYWKAMQRFAADVCNQEEVRCITYGEMVKWLEGQINQNNISVFNEYQKSRFPLMPKADLNIVSENLTSFNLEADIVKEQGSLVAKLKGADAELIQRQTDVIYQWKMDGEILDESKGKPAKIDISELDLPEGKLITLSVKKEKKELIGSTKTIRGTSLLKNTWLQNSDWENRALKGDLPEAHTENIDVKLLKKSRIW